MQYTGRFFNYPLLVAFFLFAVPSMADEGMWLFNDLPKSHLQEKYDFQPTDEWARHVMLASVRFNSGGSASFVSPRGLVLTNHHVGADTLHKLSTPERNYHVDGFLARNLEDEIPAPDLELNQLASIEDVTGRVNAAVDAEMPAEEAFRARRAVMAEIEQESLQRTGLRSDVITLYGGGQYHLYRYQKFTDVRLVWAPESAAAFFGGDADNFEYPRYCLDVCLFRVYEDGQPAQIQHFLPLSATGPAAGELVFVSGNPGRTDRIFSVAALKYQRDFRLPFVLDYIRRREIVYQQFALEGPEQERRVRDDLFGIQNARKAYSGMLRGLQDPRIMEMKEQEEKRLLREIEADPRLRPHSNAWEQIAEVQKRRAEILDQTASFSPTLYQIAEQLVFMAKEDEKPSPERLREYRDSARDSLLQQLFSPAPIYHDLEQVKMSDSLGLLAERRGGDDALVQAALGGTSPDARAAELIGGTRLHDVEVRERLAEGGLPAIRASDDPLIELALLMEDEVRRLREINDELDEIERQAYAQITQARFATEGTSAYPDATFTLRLAFGTVSGYVEDHRWIPPWTTISGAFAHARRHQNKDPWELPESWLEAKDQLNPATPFNFVSTADITGGNSGSPVLNRNKELVGVIFDGNIHSLTGDYYYSDRQSRAVSVHSAVVLEALGGVYHANRVLAELTDPNHFGSSGGEN